MVQLVTAFALAASLSLIRFRTVKASPFSVVTNIGLDVPLDLTPSRSCALSANGRWLYTIGNVKIGGKDVQFGKALRNILGGQTDMYFSKVDLSTKKVVWTAREGTSKMDTAEAVLLHEKDQYMFLAGSTYGNFAGAIAKGVSDIFINKYEVSSTSIPKPVWLKPVMIGSTAVDSVTALASEGNIIYAIGYTSGQLFAKNRGGIDSVLFTIDSNKGTILRKVQFGTAASERAMALVATPETITVVVEVTRKVNSVNVNNLQLYKFNKQLGLLGDLLLETFATESIAKILLHPKIPDAVLLVGTSKLDDNAREDLMFRRVQFDALKATKIGSTKLTHDKIQHPSFGKRHGGTKQSFEYGMGADVHKSGRVITTGFSTGKFGSGAGGSVMEPYVASLDVRDGSKESAFQKGGTKTDWFDVQCAVATDSHVYWVGKAMNWRLDSFYTYVGSFEIPREWLVAIDFTKAKPTESNTDSSPGPGEKNANNGSTGTLLGLSTTTWIYIGSGVGGGVVVLIFIIVCCCCCKKRQGK